MASKIRAKVVDCLRSGYLTVKVGYDIGLMDGGYDTEIPVDIVPPELRMPNCCFMLISNDDFKGWVGVEPYTGGPGIIPNDANSRICTQLEQIYLPPLKV